MWLCVNSSSSHTCCVEQIQCLFDQRYDRITFLLLPIDTKVPHSLSLFEAASQFTTEHQLSLLVRWPFTAAALKHLSACGQELL